MIPRCTSGPFSPSLVIDGSLVLRTSGYKNQLGSFPLTPPPPDLLLGLNCGERQRINMHEEELLVARV
jgi:hypothetical protein